MASHTTRTDRRTHAAVESIVAQRDGSLSIVESVFGQKGLAVTAGKEEGEDHRKKERRVEKYKLYILFFQKSLKGEKKTGQLTLLNHDSHSVLLSLNCLSKSI